MSFQEFDEASDDGLTLIELIVALVVVATIAVPLLLGMQTAIQASARSKVGAQVDTVLQGAVDRIEAEPFQSCGDYLRFAQEASLLEGWAFSTVGLNAPVQYWDGTNVAGLADGSVWKPCAAGVFNARALKISLRVASPSQSVVRTMEMVKTSG